MNHARTAIAASALALSAAGLGATHASAQPGPEPGSGYTTTPDCHWAYHPVCHEVPVPGNAPTASETAMDGWPDEGSGYPGSEARSPEYNHPNYDPRYEVPRVEAATVGSASDGNGAEIMRTGASALGGAGIALGAVWIHQRRRAVNG